MNIDDRPVVTVRPRATHLTKRQLPNFEGISANTAGSAGLCMHLVVIPPNVPHQPVNLPAPVLQAQVSETEEVIAVVARNDPHEQESVVVYQQPTP